MKITAKGWLFTIAESNTTTAHFALGWIDWPTWKLTGVVDWAGGLYDSHSDRISGSCSSRINQTGAFAHYVPFLLRYRWHCPHPHNENQSMITLPPVVIQIDQTKAPRTFHYQPIPIRFTSRMLMLSMLDNSKDEQRVWNSTGASQRVLNRMQQPQKLTSFDVW